jgi:transposase InsO family protein
LARLGIEHVHTSAAHPASNGAVERVVKSFKGMLRAHVNEHPEHWLQSVPVVRMQYWSRLHAALGVSPHETVFGRRPARVLPFVEVCQAAAVSLPVVAVVPDGCPSGAR